MSPDREAEVDEPLKYPSPDAEVMESGPFYNTNRDGIPEGTEDHEHHLTEHVELNDHQHEHGDLTGNEAGSPQEHLSRPANLEELQLAAQLGHGLATTPILPTTDPNMQVDESSLRSIMPHPDPEQHDETSYVQDTPTAESLAHHTLQASMLPAQYTVGIDNVPPRKRSKVSRACDECRRKKIKCDAISDTGDPPCSSCSRSATRCLFSRVPQKRGPSKGYIKELADRINSIESKLGSESGINADDLEKIFSSSRPRTDDTTRKRPFSSISAGDVNSPAQARQALWGSGERPLQPAPAANESQDGTPYNSNSLAPEPTALKPDETPSKAASEGADMAMFDGEEVPEIDEEALHEFLTNIQAVYPILPNSMERLHILLAQAPSPLKTAFKHALQIVTQRGGDAKLVSSLLNEWESSGAVASQPANIVHAQTLLMLIIDADWKSSGMLPFLLARAQALANNMKLWKQGNFEFATELDSDDQLCLRIWWSLVLMDRWHAAGTGKPAWIPDSSVVAPPALENIVGEVCLHLTRLSKLLSRISFVISHLQPGFSTTEPAMAAILNDYIENYREDLPAHIEPSSHPAVHLAYWHCRLLVTLLTPGATPAEIMWPTKELAKLFSANADLRMPLLNHFVSLFGFSLVKLSKIDKSKDEATQLINEMQDNLGLAWESVRSKVAEQMRPQSSAEAAASQGLQHLADLATANGGTAADNEFVIGPSLASGYLDIV